MKWFLMGGAMLLLCTWFMIFQMDMDRLQLETEHVKFTAQEAATAAAQYFDTQAYSEGRYIFNQEEGNKAAKFLIQTDLELDKGNKPLPTSYWRETVSYTIEYFDDFTISKYNSCSGYPCLYEHPSGNFSLALTSPSVVVTINAGKGRIRVLAEPQIERTAAHEWKDYKR